MLRHLVLVLLVLSACQTGQEPAPKTGDVYKSFGETHTMIKDHTKPVLLTDGPRQVLVAPEFAGRVMVSTLDGEKGLALGWIKPEVVTGKERDEKFVNYGAAERMWLAPEGGQYALYFPPAASFGLVNWTVPPALNHTPYTIVRKTATEVAMKKDLELVNWSDTTFTLGLERTITLLTADKVAGVIGGPVPAETKYVAYQSHNIVRNAGADAMDRDDGLVSVWIRGMFPTEGDVTVIVPYVVDDKGGAGPIVKSDYFGEVPSDRLKVLNDPPVVLFKADAGHRSKIGLAPNRTTGVMGSMDWKRGILTVVRTPVVEPKGLYVNNSWEMQTRPYAGDAVNSYNDGPAGVEERQLGYFYELETLSPARELKPGEELVHDHLTLHFQGTVAALKPIAQKLLGVDLEKLPRF